MKNLGRNSNFVRVELNIPRDTYKHLMKLLKMAKARGVTENPDVVAASCIDAVHELILKEDRKNERK